MKTDIELIEHAAALLDGEALNIRECHNLDHLNPDWKDAAAAKASHEDMRNTSTGLYAMAERKRNTKGMAA